MDDDGKNPLARFEKQRPSYLLIAASAALVVLLIAGVIMAVKAKDLSAAAIFLAATAVFVAVVLANIAANRRLAAVDDRKFIHWDAAFPELQRQNVNVEVRELARQLKVGDEQIPDLLSAYIVAEDLALRQIQQEENLPLMRHVSIGKTPFDGVLVDRDLITCIEVAFLIVPDVRQEKVDAMLKKITQAKKNLAEMKSRLRLRLMVVLVTQLTPDDDELLQGTLVKRRFKDMQVDNVEIRFLDFEMLQKLYVSEQ
jgi:hypothetical protein